MTTKQKSVVIRCHTPLVYDNDWQGKTRVVVIGTRWFTDALYVSDNNDNEFRTLKNFQCTLACVSGWLDSNRQMISALQFALSYSSLFVQAFLLQSYFFWRCWLLTPRSNRLASSLYPCFVKIIDIFHIDCKCLCKNSDSVCIWQLMVMINCWLTESFSTFSLTVYSGIL